MPDTSQRHKILGNTVLLNNAGCAWLHCRSVRAPSFFFQKAWKSMVFLEMVNHARWIGRRASHLQPAAAHAHALAAIRFRLQSAYVLASPFSHHLQKATTGRFCTSSSVVDARAWTQQRTYVRRRRTAHGPRGFLVPAGGTCSTIRKRARGCACATDRGDDRPGAGRHKVARRVAWSPPHPRIDSVPSMEAQLWTTPTDQRPCSVRKNLWKTAL